MARDIQTETTPQEGFEQTADAIEGIASVYGLCAACLSSEPSEELVSEMRAMRFPAHTGNEHMDEGYRDIATYLSRVGTTAVGELAADYSRTFIGGGIDSFSAAYPFESVHVSRKRLLMQDARDQVLAIYKAYGLEKSGQMKEGEDHIAYELEFLKALCERCAKALREGNVDEAERLARAQQGFMADHLMRWVGKFTAQMRHFSKTDFYHGVSHLTFGACKEHEALLEEMLS